MKITQMTVQERKGARRTGEDGLPRLPRRNKPRGRLPRPPPHVHQRRPTSIHQRYLAHLPRWEHVDAKWLASYEVGIQFYRAILQAGVGKMMVPGLVEDGLLEEAIRPSVAILGETLFNPWREPRELLVAANSGYYLRHE